VVEGKPFGRYRLVELLGQGGMGEVWRAYDTEIDRVVALKMLLPHFAQDHTYEQRFRREARAAARLDDPHVVPIYDVGEIEGRLYVTMRLIKGQDLQSLLDNGPLEPERAVGVIEQVASALDDAHEAGLVHRDVKPSNVLVTDDQFAYLIDFGIASAAGEAGLTNTGTTVGTWSYMAPERFKSGSVGPSADVYALACVLYQCLTGQLPYPGTTLEQLATAHLFTPPPRSSIARPGVSPAFDAVIAKGMAKDPDARYSTTRELARDARSAITAQTFVPPLPPPQPIARLAQPPGYGLPGAPPTQQGPVGPPMAPRPHAFVGPPGYPPPGRNASSSRKVIAASAVAGCIVVAAVIAIIVVGTSDDTKPQVRLADPPTTSISDESPTTTTTKPPPDIDSLLLGVGELGTIIGTTGLTIAQTGQAPDDTSTSTPPECHAISYVDGIPEYGSSGFTAMRWQVIANPSKSDSVIQGVAQFDSPEGANAFVQKLSPLFESCRGKTVTVKDRASGSETQITVDTVTTAPDVISATTHNVGGSGPCQHVIQAASSFVIEASVCAPNVDDDAGRLASAIAARTAP
jgi:serine/threonine protein kinase